MFEGSIVALVTPMTELGEIDFESLEKLIEFHIESGSDGLVVMGTTGESGTISHKAQMKIISETVRIVRERIPVIAGTGKVATHDTINLTREVMELGVQACLLLSPPYVKPTQEGLYRHFRAVAEAVPIPQILYNVPGRTCSDIFPETLARLADIPNIVGIKEATGEVKRAQEILSLCGDKLDVLSGDDLSAFDLMIAGAKGVISVTANVAPKAMHDMCQAITDDDVPLARKINERLLPLHTVLFVESNPIPVKWAVHEMGLIPAGIRLPLTPLSPSHYEAVRSAMRYSDMIK